MSSPAVQPAGILPDVARRILDARGRKTRASQAAGFAAPARTALLVRLVAGHREREVDAEPQAFLDDARLAPVQERCVQLQSAALNTGARGDAREMREGVDKLRPAIGIARVVDRVDAD